jgi:periplasmic divalent cation tolerance protein
LIFVIVVIHDRADAERIACDLLNVRLVAGYNLLDVQSAFWWKSEILGHAETFVLLRTVEGNFDRIEARVTELSGYQVPEIFAIRPDRIGNAYADWVRTEATGACPA